MDIKTTATRNLFDLSGRVALITGAGVGFGEAIAVGFAEFGCDIAACDLNIENPQRTAEQVAQIGKARHRAQGECRGSLETSPPWSMRLSANWAAWIFW